MKLEFSFFESFPPRLRVALRPAAPYSRPAQPSTNIRQAPAHKARARSPARPRPPACHLSEGAQARRHRTHTHAHTARTLRPCRHLGGGGRTTGGRPGGRRTTGDDSTRCVWCAEGVSTANLVRTSRGSWRQRGRQGGRGLLRRTWASLTVRIGKLGLCGLDWWFLGVLGHCNTKWYRHTSIAGRDYDSFLVFLTSSSSPSP